MSEPEMKEPDVIPLVDLVIQAQKHQVQHKTLLPVLHFFGVCVGGLGGMGNKHK